MTYTATTALQQAVAEIRMAYHYTEKGWRICMPGQFSLPTPLTVQWSPPMQAEQAQDMRDEYRLQRALLLLGIDYTKCKIPKTGVLAERLAMALRDMQDVEDVQDVQEEKTRRFHLVSSAGEDLGVYRATSKSGAMAQKNIVDAMTGRTEHDHISGADILVCITCPKCRGETNDKR